MYNTFLKRVVDFILSVILLIICSPVLFLMTILLAVANNGRVFFCQERPGKDGVIFQVLKFRTMTDEKGKEGELLSDELRLTTVGKIVRATSLDEIPQLINVLKGDMSLVGPRPLLIKYLPFYSEQQARRHDVRPGITGLAQINGRNNISWHNKFELDLYYVDNMGLWLDMKILLITIKKLIWRDGITKDGWSTTDTFKGNDN